MDLHKKAELKKKYAEMPDEEIIAMLLEKSDNYIEGAYELLLNEAKKRGIENQLDEKREEPAATAGSDKEKTEPESAVYVEMIIVNNEDDLSFLTSILGTTDIPFYFQNLHIRGANLPVSLMAAQPRVEDVIVLFKDFKPKASITLW